MVEIRKVIEQLRLESGSNAYPTLELYCNWAVHPWLDRAQARELVKTVDGLLSKLLNPGLNEEEHARLSDILNFENFRIEATRFLGQQDLPMELCHVDEQWLKFLQNYSRVIEDCPLVCSSDDPTLRMLDKLVFTKSGPGEETDHLPPGRVIGFNIEWEFYYKNRPLGRLTLTPDHQLLGARFLVTGDLPYAGE